MFRKNEHLFREANKCDIVPVREVPISEAYPSGLCWERPCLCPSWMSVEQTILVGAEEGGHPVTKVIAVSGCLKKLTPWLIGSAISQSSASLHETVKTRKFIEQEDPVRKFVQDLSRTLGSAHPINLIGS